MNSQIRTSFKNFALAFAAFAFAWCFVLPVSAWAYTSDGTSFVVEEGESGTVEAIAYGPMSGKASQVLFHTVKPLSGIQTLAESDYLSVDEAADYLGDHMALRESQIVTKVSSTNKDLNSLFSEILDKAVAEDESPKRGDYLRWNYGSCGGSASYHENDGVVEVTFTFKPKYYTTAAQEAAVDAKVPQVLSSLNLGSLSGYQKIKAIYDYVCENVTYDYANLNDSTYSLKYSAYAALINGTAVCQGYSTLFYRLCRESGISCRVIIGTGNGGDHAWNIVKLGDVYYDLDSTWDAGHYSYSYFLKCEADFDDHVRNNEASHGAEDYTSTEFNALYPMATASFNPNAACVHVADATVNENEVTSTCTVQGSADAVVRCGICGTEMSRTKISLPLASHDVRSVAAKAATCTENGWDAYEYCANCDHTTFQAVPAGHVLVNHPAKEPTCTAVGWFAYDTCKNCSYSTYSERAALNHAWGDWVETKAATCTEDGAKQRTCANDPSHVDQATIPAAGHMTVEHEARAATCTEPGWDAYVTCSRCDFSTKVEKSALGHDWGEWVVTKEAAVGVAGEKTMSCTRGDAVVIEEIAALPQPQPQPSEAELNNQAIAQGFLGTEATVDTLVQSVLGEEGPAGTRFEGIRTKSTKVTKSSAKVTWSKVAGAKKYVVYGAACGGKMKRLAAVTSTSFTQTKLAKGKYYKYLVAAVDAQGRVITMSKTVHVATSGGKVTNPKKVTTAAKRNKVTLKKGKTFKLKGKAVAASSKLKLKTHRKVSYQSSNAKVATVTSKGVVKAKAKGTCYVYVYAQNGVFAKVKVVVK